MVAPDGVISMLVRTGSSALTVTVTVAVMSPDSAVMVVVPAASAVKRPVWSMVPTDSSLLDQVISTPSVISTPNWSRAVAVNTSVPSIPMVAPDGVISMLFRIGAVTPEGS